jgi:hypothetical protein
VRAFIHNKQKKGGEQVGYRTPDFRVNSKVVAFTFFSNRFVNTNSHIKYIKEMLGSPKPIITGTLDSNFLTIQQLHTFALQTSSQICTEPNLHLSHDDSCGGDVWWSC